MLARHGLKIAALENFSPAFWSDILLDGPNRAAQMEGLKRLVRDAGRAGIPVIGYNFSIAGVWGWRKRRAARGGAMTVVMDLTEEERNTPIPDGMVWNMRYRDGEPAAAPVTVGEAELWERFAWFLAQTRAGGGRGGGAPCGPSRRSAGRVLARHGAAREPAGEIRPAARARAEPTPMRWNFASARSRKCPAATSTRPRATTLAGTRWPTSTSATCAAMCPSYVETFVDDGDVDMAEIVRILRDEGFEGVLVPDHVPELACAAPWHAGHAYTVGYMKALIGLAPTLGPSWSASRACHR